jgi:hypothetical protein
MKPGIFTSEFWLSLGAEIAAILVLLNLVEASELIIAIAAAIAIIVPAVYGLLRTILKKEELINGS